MTSNNKWIERVLFKLNELFIDGSDFNDRLWVFDWNSALTTEQNLENVCNEDYAIETITQANVINSRSLPNRRREEQLERFEDPRFSRLEEKDKLIYGDWYDVQPALRNYDYMRTLDKFNYDNFISFCKQINYAPSNKDIAAVLELEDGLTPVVHVNGSEYRFLSLINGSVTQKISEYAADNFNKQCTLDELKKRLSLKQLSEKGANLKQMFKKNIFSENGTLKYFVSIYPNSIRFQQQASLTPEELESIKANSRTN